MLREAEEERLTAGKHPAGIAAACLYISTGIMGNHVTQEDLGCRAEVTTVTIRNRYHELLEELDITILL